VKYGETMNFGLDKQMERIVEVLALSALLRLETENIHASDILINKYKNQLDKFAFPLDINLDEEDPTCGILFGTE